MQPSPFGRANSPQSIRGTATTEKSRGRARGRGRGRGQSAGTSPSAPSDNPSALQSNRGSTLRAGLGGLSRGVRSKFMVNSGSVDETRDRREPEETNKEY